MDSTNMEVSDNDPAAMTDAQLREELRLLGFHTGPITGGTRVVYELKLRRMRKGGCCCFHPRALHHSPY
jgi:hypothetical protein